MPPRRPRPAPAPRTTPAPALSPDRLDRLIPPAPVPEGVDRLVELGRLGRPWGVRGQVLFHRHNPDSRTLEGVDRAVLSGPGVAPRPVRVADARDHGARYLVRLAGVESPEEARMLTGLSLAVPGDALPPPGEGEWYVRDLVGCRVVDDRGAELGTCTTVFPTGSNDVLVVGEGRDERYIPLCDPFVEEVDVAARLIRVRRWEEI